MNTNSILINHLAAASALILLAGGLPSSLSAQQDEPQPREQIGAVFGKPVYRDQLRVGEKGVTRAELHRLFLTEVAKKIPRGTQGGHRTDRTGA